MSTTGQQTMLLIMTIQRSWTERLIDSNEVWRKQSVFIHIAAILTETKTKDDTTFQACTVTPGDQGTHWGNPILTPQKNPRVTLSHLPSTSRIWMTKTSGRGRKLPGESLMYVWKSLNLNLSKWNEVGHLLNFDKDHRNLSPNFSKYQHSSSTCQARVFLRYLS
jgi:hypothetical protein